MDYSETIETILKLLDLPEGQGWVELGELRTLAEKLDGGKK